MTLVLLLASMFFASNNIHAKELSPDEVKNKSYIYYKNGVTEYNKEHYDEALQQLQKSLVYRSSTRTKKLIDEIRKKGKSFYETGIALINFDKEMATQYLQKALPLIDPKDKKTIEHIKALLKPDKQD